MNKLSLHRKLLVICGPTATGKTRLAGLLAKKFNGVLISADSRQVFKGMDIGTGKDYIDGVEILGYDLVSPKSEFSVSKYLKFAGKAISRVQKAGKLPILVGGTGLYIKGVIEGIPTVEIPRNDELRKMLESKNAETLFENLSQMDAVRAGSMNVSDRNNPRRLIRAIEIAQWRLANGAVSKTPKKPATSILIIGLNGPREYIDQNIEVRVAKRVKDGLVGEIQRLLDDGVPWDNQAMSSLGYRQYRDYFEGDAPEDVVIDEWTREEKKYFRRQMTWFNKQENINWIDISSLGYEEDVEKLVQKWYSKPHAKES